MKYFCNPLNLEYKYQFHRYNKEEGGYRIFQEAADPSIILFKGKYYLFVSMSLGVYVSEDLVDWEYHPLDRKLPLYDYAPDARVMGDYVYICASRADRNCNYYRTKDILNGPYEEIPGSFPFWDPNVFCDDDGRVYFYWGSGDKSPIYGVEMNPSTMEPIGEKKELIWFKPDQYGYERFGENHITPWTLEEQEEKYQHMLSRMEMKESMLSESEREMLRRRWGNGTYLEGAWMTKYDNRYYLQYASPGTELNVYGDGVYISSNPLGPFVLADNNPYSYIPGGFMTGAGHGSTVQKEDGSWWHSATLRIAMNNKFERRVGLWKAGFDMDGELFCDQRYATWPIAVDENGKTVPFADPEWFLLSYKCKVNASSYKNTYRPENVVDEDCRTYWIAETSSQSEWIEVDLGYPMDVRAIQINFADGGWIEPLPENVRIEDDKERYICEQDQPLCWKLFGSCNGEEFYEIEDRSQSDRNLPHDLLVREKGIVVQYLRLQAIRMPFGQNACVSGIRVFGIGNGAKPEIPDFTVVRTTSMDMQVLINDVGAKGYNVLWGNSPQKLYHSCISYQLRNEIGALIEAKEYFVRVDAFNESGITVGKIKKVPVWKEQSMQKYIDK